MNESIHQQSVQSVGPASSSSPTQQSVELVQSAQPIQTSTQQPLRSDSNLQKRLILIVVLFTLFLIGISAYHFFAERHISSPISPTQNPGIAADAVSWTASTALFNMQELKAIKNALSQNGEPLGGRFVVMAASRLGNWGILTTEVVDQATNLPRTSTPGYVLLYKEGNGKWALSYSGTSSFCTQLQLAPSELTASAMGLFCK